MDKLRDALACVLLGDTPERPGVMLGTDWADAIIEQVGPLLLEHAQQSCALCGRKCAVCGARLSEIEAYHGDVCVLCGGEDDLCRTPLTGPPHRPRPTTMCNKPRGGR